MLNKIRSQIVVHAATILRPPVRLLPPFIQKKALLDALNLTFKEALEDGDFDFLEQKWLKIEITDLALIWFISYQNDALIVADKPITTIATAESLVVDENASMKHIDGDVTFRGNLNDLVLIAGRKEDPDTLFFQRRLSIEGDTELGLEVKNLMDSVDLTQLPKLMQLGLNQLADFVQKGSAPSSVSSATSTSSPLSSPIQSPLAQGSTDAYSN